MFFRPVEKKHPAEGPELFSQLGRAGRPAASLCKKFDFGLARSQNVPLRPAGGQVLFSDRSAKVFFSDRSGKKQIHISE